MAIGNVKVGDLVSFSLYGSSGISNMTNVKVVGIVSGNNITDPVIASANHTSIYPSITDTTVLNDYTSYTYLVVESVSGNVTTLHEIGIPWIIPTSFIIGNRLTAIVTITGFDPVDEPKLAELLRIYGFSNAVITVS